MLSDYVSPVSSVHRECAITSAGAVLTEMLPWKLPHILYILTSHPQPPTSGFNHQGKKSHHEKFKYQAYDF